MASTNYTMVLNDARLKDRVKSLDSILNLDGLGIFEIMSSPKYNVSTNDPTITKDVQEYVVLSRERDLLHKSKATIQGPPLGPFFKMISCGYHISQVAMVCIRKLKLQ